jgi:hypothetical protein
MVFKIYYSHAKKDYDTQFELDNINAIRAKYPDATIFNPKILLKGGNYVTPIGFSAFMEDLQKNCFPKIDECDKFIVSKYKHGKYTTGVKKELEYAKYLGKHIEDFDLPYPLVNRKTVDCYLCGRQVIKEDDTCAKDDNDVWRDSCYFCNGIDVSCMEGFKE